MNARWVMLSALCLAGSAPGEDWPQWRGPNRDARVSGFTAPKMWPKELTKKWSIPIGEGVSTPALVGDKLYTFSRQDGKEITRCLEAATGKEIWKDQYESGGATGGASRFSGPRSSPAVADGKVVTLGVRGMLSCFDAASGKKLWRKEDYTSSPPMFYVSSSPILIDGLCIAQLGGNSDGAIVAYDLTSGAEKWKWKGDGVAYASPTLLTLSDSKIVVAETSQQVVSVNVADGKLVWKTPLGAPGGPPGGGKGGPPGGGKGGPPGGGKGGGGMRLYNASTPMVDGQTLIYSGSRGTKAVHLEKKGDEIVAKELWNNTEGTVQFNTPVIKDGMVFGLTGRNELFCITKDGKTAWTSAIKGQGGYGSIVDAGSVLLSLTPAGQLLVFEPSAKGFKDLATYKVAEKDTYAYPVVSGNRIYVKDADAVTLYAIE